MAAGVPPKASRSIGEWLSLVEHLVRDQGVGGSNPLSPTILAIAQNFESNLHSQKRASLFGLMMSRRKFATYSLSIWSMATKQHHGSAYANNVPEPSPLH